MAEPVNNSPTPAASPLEAPVAELEKKFVGSWFWSTFWIPLASYGWSVYWMVRGKRLNGIQKVVIVIFDFLWFFAFAMLLTIIAVYVCHGGFDAWLARQAVKLVTPIGFEWCANIPDPGINL